MQNNILTRACVWLPALALMQHIFLTIMFFSGGSVATQNTNGKFPPAPLKMFQVKGKDKMWIQRMPTTAPAPSLPQPPPMHPLYTPTRSVQEFPLERQTQIIGHRFLLAGHKGTSYSPLRSCLLPILPSLLPTSCVPSNDFPTTTAAAATTTTTIRPELSRSSSSKHSLFHCHNKAIRTHASHDPDPEPSI